MKQNAKFAKFKKTIWDYYKKDGRTLPWRETKDPYRILVSEIMLQQTQVGRVREKYKLFTSLFPDIHILARASFAEVLRAWSGLGYNRRAKFLHQLAKDVESEHTGVIPSRIPELVKLPGLGHATASSFLAFAYNQPTVFIETNIRTVFLHFFFREKEVRGRTQTGRRITQKKIHDKEISPLVEQTLDRKNPREWYWALMDYGTMLKSGGENPGRRSIHHVKQPRFEGSLRQLRGRILAECLKVSPVSRKVLARKLESNSQKIEQALRGLADEGFLEIKREKIKVRS